MNRGSTYECITMDDNIFGAPKMCNNLWSSIKIFIFQYCGGKIGLFSIAPHTIIALSTLQ